MKSGRKRDKKEGRKSIVVMASRRRAMKKLGRVILFLDTTSGGSPRLSLRETPKRGREILI